MPSFESPFLHRVVDDWAVPELVRAADAEWPEHNWPHWHRYDNGKLTTKDPLRFRPACAELIRRMLCLLLTVFFWRQGGNTGKRTRAHFLATGAHHGCA